MAFIVQNDAGDVADANALVDVPDFAAYHTDRGFDLTPYDQAKQEAAIVKATDYMAARWQWSGTAISETTPWPREDAYAKGYLVEGIPLAVKRACYEYALIALLGTDLWKDPAADSAGRIVVQESVSAGSVSTSTTYAQPSTRPRGSPSYPIADAILRRAGLIPSSSGTLLRA